jgi:hypothetical protein
MQGEQQALSGPPEEECKVEVGEVMMMDNWEELQEE